MEGSGKRRRDGSGGPKWKKLKQEDGKLVLGSRGILVTNCVSGKHKEAMQELLHILREHSESFHPSPSSDPDPREAGNDVESLLQRDKSLVGADFSRFRPGPCLSKGLNFLRFNSHADVPSEYIREIFEQIKASKRYSARFISKAIPVDRVVAANINDLERALTDMLSHIVTTNTTNSTNSSSTTNSSTNSSSSSGTTTNSSTTTIPTTTSFTTNSSPITSRNSASCGSVGNSGSSWALEFKRTNSNSLDREAVLELVTRLIGGRLRVDLRSPDYLIIVHVIKNSCGLAVVKGYEPIAHFKLNISIDRQ